MNREPFHEITELLRRLLPAAATTDPPLRPREWRVLAAVLAVTAAWSKREDRVSHQQLAAASGLTDSGTLRKELNSLTRRGLITYAPGGGRGKMSTVGLPTLDSLAPLSARETPVGTEPLPKGLVGKNQPRRVGSESERTGTRGSRRSPTWLPDGAYTEAQKDAADRILDRVCDRLVIELEDGNEQVKALKEGIPTLKFRARLVHWLAEVAADEAMTRLAVERLSGSYEETEYPERVFYTRLAGLIATLEGDGYQLPGLRAGSAVADGTESDAAHTAEVRDGSGNEPSTTGGLSREEAPGAGLPIGDEAAVDMSAIVARLGLEVTAGEDRSRAASGWI